MEIRRFGRSDEAAFLCVHVTAIREVASRDYSPQQIEAWAPVNTDRDEWAGRMRVLRPFVADLDGEIVGYANLLPDRLIDHFYVSSIHPRQEHQDAADSAHQLKGSRARSEEVDFPCEPDGQAVLHASWVQGSRVGFSGEGGAEERIDAEGFETQQL